VKPDKPSFFPRETTSFAAVEISVLRTLTLSSLEMGALTGVLLRAFRAVALTHGSATSWVYVGATLVAGAAALFGVLALHVANFPVRRWPKRVALFVLAEWGAEMATSALLIALHREPLGSTGRATWGDWPTVATRALLWRVVAVGIFAVVLAIVVQTVRSALDRRRLPRHAHVTPND
jgi:hypothetical protein